MSVLSGVPPAIILSICLLSSSSSVLCSPYSGNASPAQCAPWYNNSTPCTGLIFVSLRAMRGPWLSFSMTALHTHLPFYFEAWLTGRQPWHSCRRCGACYYAYINILINTWSAIEEIITCHHSTVWKECALLCAHARTHIHHIQHLRVSSHKYDLCSSRSSPSINKFNSSTSHMKSTLEWKDAVHDELQLLKLIVYCIF